MNNKITGKEYPLSKIFSKDFDYHIPSYQRPYSWDEGHTETLFQSLYDFYSEKHTDDYFLGSIVLIKQDNIAHADVVDGQQRLTTLTILLATIANHLTEESFKNGCQKYVMEPGDVIEGIVEQPRVHLRDKDQAFFKKYIQDGDIKGLLALDSASLPNESQQHIKCNCEIIDKMINKYFGDNEQNLKDFCTFVVMKCFLVVVSTASQESAFRIFSVMNSTGLDLSTSDIIKSDVIGKIEAAEQQDYTDKWEDMEIKTSRQGFADLFSHIRMIIMKVKAKKSLLDEFKENVLPKYAPKDLIDKVIEPYADCYAMLKNCSYKSTENANEINSLFMWLNKTENFDWIPPMLIFMNKHKNNSKLMLWFTAKIERLAAYLHITGKDVNERIERYSRVIEELEKRNITDNSKSILSVELSQDEKEEFVSVLNGEIYNLTSKRRNYVILRLDSFVGDDGATYSPKILTIEHVLPQTVNTTSSWAKLWPDENNRKIWLNRIANLVPLTRRKNSEAQNYDFGVKKLKYFNGTKGTTSYALTSQVLSVSDWTMDVVKKRQDTLLNVFKTKWDLN